MTMSFKFGIQLMALPLGAFTLYAAFTAGIADTFQNNLNNQRQIILTSRSYRGDLSSDYLRTRDVCFIPSGYTSSRVTFNVLPSQNRFMGSLKEAAGVFMPDMKGKEYNLGPAPEILWEVPCFMEDSRRIRGKQALEKLNSAYDRIEKVALEAGIQPNTLGILKFQPY